MKVYGSIFTGRALKNSSLSHNFSQKIYHSEKLKGSFLLSFLSVFISRWKEQLYNLLMIFLYQFSFFNLYLVTFLWLLLLCKCLLFLVHPIILFCISNNSNCFCNYVYIKETPKYLPCWVMTLLALRDLLCSLSLISFIIFRSLLGLSMRQWELCKFNKASGNVSHPTEDKSIVLQSLLPSFKDLNSWIR